MSSNVILIFCLIAGFLLGLFSPYKGTFHQKLLMVSIILLIFFMGAILGYPPDLGQRMISYGYTALIITGSAVFFSIVSVWVVVRLFTRREGGVK